MYMYYIRSRTLSSSLHPARTSPPLVVLLSLDTKRTHTQVDAPLHTIPCKNVIVGPDWGLGPTYKLVCR
jgi:hypothetical protein